MISADFRAMDLQWRQRLCFWSGFGYYISTAVTAFTALIPPIFLLWFDPHAIHDRNYLLLLPVVLAYPLVVFLHRGQWTFSVLRIQLAYSFAHAVAVWDTWRGHTADWVATGAASSTPLSNRVSRIMCGWLLAIEVALWAGIARNLSAGIVPLTDMYPLILFAAFALYLQAPLIAATLHRPRPTRLIMAGAAT
jgi:cellulose synthase (UDP-forming)